MKIRAEQALFGYDDGHRLLTSSRPIAAETKRLLRTLTDAAFEGAATTYLTVQPLPSENVQAFIRTWRADDWNRPGSVWSHVLLVEHSELSKMTGLGGIAAAFRRPEPVAGALSEGEYSAYQQTLKLSGGMHVEMPPLDHSALSELVQLLYSSNAPVQYRVKAVRDVDTALLALTEQQWPRLRRTFSCRTRQRSTTGSGSDLELVERLSKSTPANAVIANHGPGNWATWVEHIVQDLLRPDDSFRVFLRLCGTESRAGRSAFPDLVELYDRIARPNPDVVTTAISVRHAFPSPASQTLLKKALFGVAGAERLGGWPTAEIERLLAALAAAPAIDLKELEFGTRLARLAQTPGGGELMAQMDLEALPLDALEPVVAEIAEAVDLDAAVALAQAMPDLGALVVSRRPELLGQPVVWENVDNGLLLDLLDVQTPSTVAAVLQALVAESAVEPLAAVTSAHPSRWWELLGLIGARESVSLVEGAALLRAVLSRIGSAALGSPPPDRLQSPGDLVALALSADLGVGLWRRAPAKDWASLLQVIEQLQVPRYVTERVYAIALSSALQSSSAKVRTQGWQQSFDFLHAALLDNSFDDEAWRLLANVLPAGSEWDRCSRLRRGAAWEARRDEWPPNAVAQLIEGSRPFQNDMFELINTRAGKRKKDSWLRSVLRLLG